jgi:hypothetical protein
VIVTVVAGFRPGEGERVTGTQHESLALGAVADWCLKQNCATLAPGPVSVALARSGIGLSPVLAGDPLTERLTTDGATVSLTKLREAWVAALPAASLWLAVTVMVPSASAETLRVALQAPLEQVPEVVTAPEATLTVRPFSEQVPDTAKAEALAALT